MVRRWRLSIIILVCGVRTLCNVRCLRRRWSVVQFLTSGWRERKRGVDILRLPLWCINARGFPFTMQLTSRRGANGMLLLLFLSCLPSFLEYQRLPPCYIDFLLLPPSLNASLAINVYQRRRVKLRNRERWGRWKRQLIADMFILLLWWKMDIINSNLCRHCGCGNATRGEEE